MKTKYITILILMGIAVIFSGILTFSNVPELCDITQGCNVVQSSNYSAIFGIKNSLFGMIAFTAIGFVIYHHIKHPRTQKKKIIQLGMIIGSLVALYFIYIQFFILNAICKYCMVVDIATLLSLAILLFWKEK
jgi:uncharacterized membrane protein